MKKILFLFILVTQNAKAQNKDLTDWITNNALLFHFNINDSIAAIELPDNAIGSNFLNASLYGFGEATHNHKEFSTMKFLFFKYLVENQGVKSFILEESFGVCFEINDYIVEENKTTKNPHFNFKQAIWQSQETYDLIHWIKEYNKDKLTKEKINVYGIDYMFNYKLVTILKELLTKNNIIIPIEYESFLNFYSEEKNYKTDFKVDDISFKTIEDLKALINQALLNYRKNDIQYIVEMLHQFLFFLNKPSQKDRDQFMAQNIERILENTGSKAFISAHNEHVKKTFLFNSNIPTMGNYLNKKYENNYFAVGFEFGKGEMISFDTKNKTSEIHVLKEPIKNTNSNFLYDVSSNAFYLDFQNANANSPVLTKFLSTKNNYLIIGGLGFNRKFLKYSIAAEKYIAMYDALIYIKEITLKKKLTD